ncbi:FecR family protein [Parasegetibacter sp. NRK P23]|uniref:FecR family protein n=1 Tax=Parasegetibacter sp. NRK P23 TaxID=2942999 RepID=UPI002043B761|nr:FecR family protein [Parasegetibacter sp. NRK P23]MCM5528414.1 FecR domain-containing protein [Parasegetibacter sp. NRK P23]
MEHENPRIAQLYGKWMDRSASEQEMEELFSLLKESGLESGQYNPLLKENWDNTMQSPPPFEERHRKMVETILEKYPGNTETIAPVKKLMPWRNWWAAALLLLAVGFGIYHKLHTAGNATVKETIVKNDILPGSNGAILTLADGTQVLLDTIANGTIQLQGGIAARVVNGTLLYEAQDGPAQWNTITTPAARQFQLILPDGTKAWLNAQSAIRYPTAFSGNERRVEVSGEVYLEVSHDKTRPFLVQVNNSAVVEVLGTRFNINAYTNEDAVRTTLLEGSVAVREASTGKGDNQPAMLEPGEQAIAPHIPSGKPLSVLPVDTEKVIAWKNGMFNFEGMGLQETMRQLERWYNIQVVYEGTPPVMQFFGKIERNTPLSAVLEALKGFGLNCKMENQTLLISR